MKTFTLKDTGDVNVLRSQLFKDGFELVQTLEDGTEIYNQVNPPKVKPWTAMDQYKKTKATIKKHYDYGISHGLLGRSLTDWMKA